MKNPTKTKPKFGYTLLFFLPGLIGLAALIILSEYYYAAALAVIIAAFAFILHYPKCAAKHKANGNDFSHINYEAFKDNQNIKLTEIALAGAHDAFTHNMTYCSQSDFTEKQPFNLPFLANAARGLICRLSKAQVSDCYTLLVKGARFFDVRICELENSFATKHGIISDTLENYITDMLKFLNKNKGEIIVFAMQYCTFSSGGFDKLFDCIRDVKYEGKSLLDYASYSTSTPLSELTYKSLTHGGIYSSVVFLGKIKQAGYTGKYTEIIYDFTENIRITWHNKMTHKDMLSGIRKEADLIARNKTDYSRLLRVNQAQKTPNFALQNITKIITCWSLIDISDNWNNSFVDAPDFDLWLSSMPIVFADFLDCNKRDFNKKFIDKIQAYNLNLKG